MASVYVVDDSISVRKAVEHLLGGRGLDVMGTGSGRQALTDLALIRPDVIVCDLVLPDVDGYEICRFVKTDPGLADVPVLLISGIVDDEVRARAAAVGADGLFRKPFVGEELYACVERLLAERAAESAREAAVSRVFAGEATELEALPGFELALLVSPSGAVLEQLGPATGEAAKALAHGIHQLAGSVSVVARQLGRGGLNGLLLEHGDGYLLLRQASGERWVVLSLRSAAGVGKARFLLRRIEGRLRPEVDEVVTSSGRMAVVAALGNRAAS